MEKPSSLLADIVYALCHHVPAETFRTVAKGGTPRQAHALVIAGAVVRYLELCGWSFSRKEEPPEWHKTPGP